MKKLDRRVIRTRKLLAEAMLSLLLTKDYDEVTVQDITEAADLNRATFYLHYGSKESLLEAALEARFDELVKRMDVEWSTEDGAWEDASDLLLVFEHAAEYAALYKVLLGNKGRAHVINRIIDYTAAVQGAMCREQFPNLPELAVPLDIVNQHIAGSLYALLRWWLMNDMPHSAEYMANAANRLCMRGVLPLFADVNSATWPADTAAAAA